MTTMSLSPEVHAAIIAKLTASYGRPTSATPTRADIPAARSKLATLKAQAEQAKDDGSQAAPANRLLITSAPLPVKGSLDAKGYIVSMRRAATRQDRINAIAGFVGFDPHGEYATQELSANMTAQRELRGTPKPLTRPVHSASVSVAGYVSGVPDHVARRRADLIGRETLAAESMADYLRQAEEAKARGDEASAVMFAGMAQVESERLAQIKRDLAAL